MFNALVVEKDDDGKTHAAVRQVAADDLPDGQVTVAVEYSTLNYKDGLCIGPGAGLVRAWPHVPGIDFAGTVEQSADSRYRPGDKVVLTGWRVGETRWGGYAQKARVDADWLIPLPDGLTTRQAMAVGTAGLTAMLAIAALEDRGLDKADGPVLVTGAAGGVGSVATALLAARGMRLRRSPGAPRWPVICTPWVRRPSLQGKTWQRSPASRWKARPGRAVWIRLQGRCLAGC